MDRMDRMERPKITSIEKSSYLPQSTLDKSSPSRNVKLTARQKKLLTSKRDEPAKPIMKVFTSRKVSRILYKGVK